MTIRFKTSLSFVLLSMMTLMAPRVAGQTTAPAGPIPRAIIVETPPAPTTASTTITVRPNDQARYLAGMPLIGTSLEGFAQEADWQSHAAQFERAWQDLDGRQLSLIRQWAPSVLSYAYRDTSPLFYMFSGPDFLYANAFYPNASTYIMCGQEPVGPIPDVTALSPASRAYGLRNMHQALNAILSFSFFITKDMKVDLKQTQLSGTLPILYVFLARSGAYIQNVELVRLSSAGEIVKEGKGTTPGVKISFRGSTGRRQTLYYFTTDLSNWGIKNNPGFIAFCKKQGQGNAFLKAASYLMHSDNFSSVRNFLLSQTRTLIEDDSGIPYRYFKPEEWVVGCYGNYVGPIELFEQHHQYDLDSAFRAGPAQKIPFGFGYQWKPGISSLIVATSLRSVPKAQVTE